MPGSRRRSPARSARWSSSGWAGEWDGSSRGRSRKGRASMRLDTLERHREATGPLQRLDARVKLIVALALIIAVIAMPIAAWRWYGGAGLFLAFIVGLSGIPPREVARRWLGLFVLVAFLVVMIAPAHPERARYGLLAVAASILAKNGLALMTMIVLAGPTPFPRLLTGVRRVGGRR